MHVENHIRSFFFFFHVLFTSVLTPLQNLLPWEHSFHSFKRLMNLSNWNGSDYYDIFLIKIWLLIRSFMFVLKSKYEILTINQWLQINLYIFDRMRYTIVDNIDSDFWLKEHIWREQNKRRRKDLIAICGESVLLPKPLNGVTWDIHQLKIFLK